MERIFSGIQPTNDLHLGNYFGALRNWVTLQESAECTYCIVDLHSLTASIEPAELPERTLRLAVMLLAIGLDPPRTTIFVQSHVPAHAELAWLLQCVTPVGELNRMTQFKEKSHGRESVSTGLFTYPVLQAADILLYDAAAVPIGEDQKQHLELSRDIAQRFNNRFGDTFVIPEPLIPGVAARVMDLQHPERKMSKSADSALGTIFLLDSSDDIAAKVKRAVTDSEPAVSYDPQQRPGVSNLIEILAASTEGRPDDIASRYSTCAQLKADTADAVNAAIEPVRARYASLSADLGEVAAVLRNGADQAVLVASATLRRAYTAVGLYRS